MKKDSMNENNEGTALTEKDFRKFLSATGERRWKILLAHAEKNQKSMQVRRLKTMEQKTDRDDGKYTVEVTYESGNENL